MEEQRTPQEYRDDAKHYGEVAFIKRAAAAGMFAGSLILGYLAFNYENPRDAAFGGIYMGIVFTSATVSEISGRNDREQSREFQRQADQTGANE